MASLYKKPIVRRDPKTGEKVKTKSKKWWGRYTDSLGREKRVPLAADKQAALTMLNNLVQKVEHEKAGIEDPFEQHRGKPIADHMADFRRHLLAKGDSEEHIVTTIRRIERFLEHGGIRNVTAIDTVAAGNFLAELREEGSATETRNHYLRAMKHFTSWLDSGDRLMRDPLRKLSPTNADADRRRVRRALSDEEYIRLIETAENGPPIESIPGPDRAMIYILAAWTGYRKGEIGSLTRGSFDIESEPPTVTVQAAYSKRRREDTQVLHPWVVERLKAWLLDRDDDESALLFPICGRVPGGTNRKTAKMMREDLAAARRKWIAETKQQRKSREKSDFLRYQDSKKRYADFHANRHTFITNLCRAGVSPKIAQSLARHSTIRLTMDLYTHLDDKDKIEGIHALRGLGGEGTKQP